MANELNADRGTGAINDGEPQQVTLSGAEYERYLCGALNEPALVAHHDSSSYDLYPYASHRSKETNDMVLLPVGYDGEFPIEDIPRLISSLAKVLIENQP